MKAQVELYIQQVADGTHYRGHIEIGESRFEYDLQFTVPIPEIDEMEAPKDQDDARRIFPISLSKGGTAVDLTNDEYGFFFQMLAVFAVDFYNNPQTRASQEGLIGEALRSEPNMSGPCFSATAGMTSNATYDFPDKLCGILNAPKFGCAIAA